MLDTCCCPGSQQELGFQFSSVQSLSHVWLFVTPWTDCSTPGFPVHHQLLEHTQTHAHWVSDAIEPSHPLLSPCCPAFRLSQCHGFYQWVGFSHQVAKVSEPQLQHQSFQWIFRINFLFNWLVWSSCSSRDSQESPPAPQFERIISLVLSLLYGPILTSVHDYWKKT